MKLSVIYIIIDELFIIMGKDGIEFGICVVISCKSNGN